MGIVVDHHVAIDALRKCVEQRGPDYVYTKPDKNEGCQNWHTDEDGPGCMIGLALYNLGMPADVLHKYRFKGVSSVAGHAKREGVIGPDQPIQEITDHAVTLFMTAQVEQDSYATWGQALKAAEAAYRDIEGRI